MSPVVGCWHADQCSLCSILALLKARGWATGLVAGTENEGLSCNTSSWLFIVAVTLTKEVRVACSRYAVRC